MPANKLLTGNIPLAIDDEGILLVAVTGESPGGTSSVDETPFAAGVSAGTPIMAYDPTSGDLVICETEPGTRILAVSGESASSVVDETPFSAGVSAGTPLMGYDPTSGELLIARLSPGTRVLEVVGTFSAAPPASSTASIPARQTVGSTSGSILAANALRKGCGVQNVSTVPVYLGLGQDPTATAYHIALPAGGSSNDGSSPVWDGTFSGVLWQGAVNAITAAGGGAVVVTELT